jgi:ATP synthase protein I
MSPKKPAQPESTGCNFPDRELEKRLHALEQRIEQGKAPAGAEPATEANAAAYGRGMRLLYEFVAGIMVGGFFGWLIDQLFGTLPLGLIVFLLLGFAAGIYNMARASRQAERAAKDSDE